MAIFAPFFAARQDDQMTRCSNFWKDNKKKEKRWINLCHNFGRKKFFCGVKVFYFQQCGTNMFCPGTDLSRANDFWHSTVDRRTILVVCVSIYCIKCIIISCDKEGKCENMRTQLSCTATPTQFNWSEVHSMTGGMGAIPPFSLARSLWAVCRLEGRSLHGREYRPLSHAPLRMKLTLGTGKCCKFLTSQKFHVW